MPVRTEPPGLRIGARCQRDRLLVWHGRERIEEGNKSFVCLLLLWRRTIDCLSK